jgi:hypothetical protein
MEMASRASILNDRRYIDIDRDKKGLEHSRNWIEHQVPQLKRRQAVLITSSSHEKITTLMEVSHSASGLMTIALRLDLAR